MFLGWWREAYQSELARKPFWRNTLLEHIDCVEEVIREFEVATNGKPFGIPCDETTIDNLDPTALPKDPPKVSVVLNLSRELVISKNAEWFKPRASVKT